MLLSDRPPALNIEFTFPNTQKKNIKRLFHHHNNIFAVLSILQFSAVLQSEEHIPVDSRNPLKQSPEVTYSSFTSVQENCLHTKKTHLVLPIPFIACPEFESDLGKPELN